jgi:L-cysteine S-thiosulfotransferase
MFRRSNAEGIVMKTPSISIAAAMGFLLASLAQACAQQTAAADPAAVEKAFNGMFGKASPEWQARVAQDETQRICSVLKNEPSVAEFDRIVAREKATLVFPADGKVTGDWKAGQAIAQRGTGGQFSDSPGTVQGGNCYACHQLSKAEVSFGNLGPSLTDYGRDRKFAAEDAKAAYAKIYNAQSVMACSTMPRFGLTKFLTEQQIKDVVAYLFDPESPVNK